MHLAPRVPSKTEIPPVAPRTTSQFPQANPTLSGQVSKMGQVREAEADSDRMEGVAEQEHGSVKGMRSKALSHNELNASDAVNMGIKLPTMKSMMFITKPRKPSSGPPNCLVSSFFERTWRTQRLKTVR